MTTDEREAAVTQLAEDTEKILDYFSTGGIPTNRQAIADAIRQGMALVEQGDQPYDVYNAKAWMGRALKAEAALARVTQERITRSE